MEKTLQKLRIIYWVIVGLLAAFALIIEFFLIDMMGGTAVNDTAFEFYFQIPAIFLTLGALYFALRLFTFKAVKEKIMKDPQTQYLPMSVVRMALLEGAVLFDLIGYMLFVSSSFAWLGLIAFIGFFFIYPNEERFINETSCIEK